MRALTTLLTLLMLTFALAGCADDAPTAPSSAVVQAAPVVGTFPDVIALPNGFSPEGIAFGRGTTFYVGSLSTGAIFRGDVRTGTGDLLVSVPGREQVGMKYDERTDRLFVAGGFSGQAYVYDASTGAPLAMYQLADPSTGPTLVNDVVVLRDAAYFTDSFRQVIYRLPLAHNGALPAGGAVEELPLTGDFEFIPDAFVTGNANGIVATPNEKQLIVVNTTTGRLYLVDPKTGQTTEIDLSGALVMDGDGLVLVGQTLYVVQGPLNQIAVVRLNRDFTSGVMERVITDPDFAFPSTIAAFGNSLYAVNARFDVVPGANVEYQVVRVPR